MTPEKVTVVKYDDIDAWIRKHLQPRFPDKHISVIPHDWDATGESKFVVDWDMDEDITVDELCNKIVDEHSRGPYIHFYARDVLSAAYTNGDLKDTYCILFYRW